LIRYHALKSFSDQRYSALTHTLPRGVLTPLPLRFEMLSGLVAALLC
jgi:hypothetical protein